MTDQDPAVKKEFTSDEERRAAFAAMAEEEGGGGGREKLSKVSSTSDNDGVRRIALAANDMGIPSSMLRYSETQYTEDGMDLVGAYNEDTGLITLFPAAADLDSGTLYGMLSHEYNHHLYEKAGGRDGLLEIAKEVVGDDAITELSKMGGITQYSQSFWRTYKWDKSASNLDNAINETLAEVAYKKSIGEPVENDIWEDIYNRMVGKANG